MILPGSRRCLLNYKHIISPNKRKDAKFCSEECRKKYWELVKLKQKLEMEASTNAGNA